MILLPVLATFRLRIKTTYGAPHQTINAIQEQLKALGYSISSADSFENSLRCDTCQVTFKFQKSFQAVWLLRRHTREKAHQVKAGWILDDENNVQRSKLKGKQISCVFFFGGGAVSWLSAVSPVCLPFPVQITKGEIFRILRCLFLLFLYFIAKSVKCSPFLAFS